MNPSKVSLNDSQDLVECEVNPHDVDCETEDVVCPRIMYDAGYEDGYFDCMTFYELGPGYAKNYQRKTNDSTRGRDMEKGV